MERTRHTTPLTTPSRASTIALDSSERGAQTSPSMSSSQSSDTERLLMQAEIDAHTHYKQAPVQEFKPLQMLMETPISIEYGDDLTSQLTMHEELLRCHSKSFDQLCGKAKALREQYAQADILMQSLAKFVFPEVTIKQFESAAMEGKVIPLILQIANSHPLQEYHNNIKKVIDVAVENQFTLKNSKVPQSTGGVSKKRDSKDTSCDMSLRGRIPLLNSRGVQTVAERLYAALHRMKRAEAGMAKEDPVRAVAQRRILLPGIQDTTVRLFVQWVYQGSLYYEDAEQLYALLNLATSLGADVLAEMCLSKLTTAATDSITTALTDGIPLQTLIAYGSGNKDNVLEVIFINVFKDENPPKRLLKLVIDTLAKSLDMALWAQIKDLIGHKMALDLIEAMVVRKQVKTEQFYQTSMKSESDVTTPE